MKTHPYLLHALSPLHAGTGQAIDLIDLPIARMRATGIPFVPGSSIKGVLRDTHERDRLEDTDHTAVFGPRRDRDPQKAGPAGDNPDDLDHAGALIVGDARLLALPVRSFKGTFAFTTSPLLLQLAHRDLAAVGCPEPPPLLDGSGAWRSKENANMHGEKVYLEECDLPVTENRDAAAWTKFLAATLPDTERDLFRRRFLIVDDDTMSFLWQTALQIDTRIRIDRTTRAAAGGALWTEESLPPETLLIGLLAASDSHRPKHFLPADRILDIALPGEQILQFGGKATVGRGRCRITRWPLEPRTV